MCCRSKHFLHFLIPDLILQLQETEARHSEGPLVAFSLLGVKGWRSSPSPLPLQQGWRWRCLPGELSPMSPLFNFNPFMFSGWKTYLVPLPWVLSPHLAYGIQRLLALTVFCSQDLDRSWCRTKVHFSIPSVSSLRSSLPVSVSRVKSQKSLLSLN